MKRITFLTFLFVFGCCFCILALKARLAGNQQKHPSILKVEMSLSAFGVESDGFPYIDAILDFSKNSSVCKVHYDNPTFKPSSYSLTQKEMKHILTMLQVVSLDTLKREYKFGPTDQPTSTTTIYTSNGQIKVTDYALQAGYPLNELYKVVYKLEKNFR